MLLLRIDAKYDDGTSIQSSGGLEPAISLCLLERRHRLGVECPVSRPRLVSVVTERSLDSENGRPVDRGSIPFLSAGGIKGRQRYSGRLCQQRRDYYGESAEIHVIRQRPKRPRLGGALERHRRSGEVRPVSRAQLRQGVNAKMRQAPAAALRWRRFGTT